MKRVKLFVENFLAYGAINILNKIIPLLLLPVITRMLADPSDFGIYDMYNTIIGFATPLIMLGIYDAMFREFFEKNDVQYRYDVTSTANRIVMVTSTAASLFLIGFSSVFSQFFFRTPKYNFVVILAAIEIFLSNNRTIIAGPTRIQNKRMIYVFSGLFTSLTYYVLAILLIYLGYSFYGMIYANIISTFIILVFFFILNKSYFTQGSYDKEIAKELLRIGLPLVPTFIIYWIFNSMDKLMIANLLGTAELGIYSIGSKMASVSSLIYAAFSGGFSYFKFSTMKDADQVEFNSKLFEYLGLISFISFLVIYPFIPVVFEFLFPASYAGGEYVVPYLFISPLLLMLFQIVGSQFIVTKKTYMTTITLALGAFGNVALNWLLIPIIGVEGAALATLLGYSLSLIIVNLIGQYYEVHIISKRFVVSSAFLTLYWLIARLAIQDEFWKQFILSGLFILFLLFVYKNVVIKFSKKLLLMIKNKQ